MATINGYVDYQKREYCKAIKCTVQTDLDKYESGSDEYEKIRLTCKNACIHTTHEFHSWLINAGYLVVRPE